MPGATYFFRVYNAASGAGSGIFSVGVTSPRPDCPVVFSPPTSSTNISSNGIMLKWNSTSNTTGYDVYLDSIYPPTIKIASNIPDTNVFSGPLTIPELQTYYWTVISRNLSDSSTECQVNLFSPALTDINIHLRIFIEGYYRNGSMRAVLDPNLKPGIADSVWITLRDTVPPFDSLFACKTELDTNGYAHCHFTNDALGSYYYLVVNTRNAIQIWSKPFFLSESDLLIDFTTKPDSTTSGGRILVPSSTGLFGMSAEEIDRGAQYLLKDPNENYLDLPRELSVPDPDLN